MIQAEHLRINNWVKAKNEFLIVRSLYYNGQIGLSDGNCYFDNEIYPIPLSPDILEKCGFVEHEYFWSKNWGDNGVEIIKFDDYYKGFLFELGKGRSKLVQHLHQLQNLFFCLTGQELTYKQQKP